MKLLPGGYEALTLSETLMAQICEQSFGMCTSEPDSGAILRPLPSAVAQASVPFHVLAILK